MVLIACLCVGCNARDGVGAQPPGAQRPADVAVDRTRRALAIVTPATVLDGTALVELQSFPQRPLDRSAAGSYGAEHGGAELSLTLSVQGEHWTLVRTVQEPGEAAATAVYRLVLNDGAMSSIDGNVVVRGTPSGLLVLERASDVVSSDYWVIYPRKE